MVLLSGLTRSPSRVAAAGDNVGSCRGPLLRTAKVRAMRVGAIGDINSEWNVRHLRSERLFWRRRDESS